MKTVLPPGIFNRPVHFIIMLACLAATTPLQAQPVLIRSQPAKPATLTASLSSVVKPYPVLAAMQRVADWQLAHPSTNRPTGWVQAVGDVGMMALAGISGDPKYREAMLAKGEADDWKLAQYRGRKYHADDQCEGQVWTELYFLYRENQMIEPLRKRFDYILAHPPDVHSLDFTQPHGRAQELWSWCDSLFMAPPTWVRLYAATGDGRYLDFAVTNWWRTADYLYDKNEHLFFRDSTYFDKHETNGQKVFWSRGNGWVMAGLVRVLQYLPTNHPDRPRFEQLFKDMAAKVLTLQQPDGFWRASLLDPKDYPETETSGSALFTYALAWGVNQGLLDRVKCEPAVRKGWAALVDCVAANGKLTNVQPVGDAPTKFTPDSNRPYGVGAFLLAGSEIYRMAVLHGAAMKFGATIPQIKMENVPLSEAIQNLAQQAHINYVLDSSTGLGQIESGPVISGNWTNATADQVLRELLKDHNLHIEQNPHDGTFFISAKRTGNRHAVEQELAAISTNDLGIPKPGVTFAEQIWSVVKVTNPSDFFRHCETIEISLDDVETNFIWNADVRFAVMDGVSSRILDSQTYASEPGQAPDKLLFQVDLVPGETRKYYILDASALAAVPPPVMKTFARYVPERHDDFAWESDRIAHRIFGKALETWKEEPLTSSGVDVWIKRTRHLVINDMYRTMNFFNIQGPAQDDYRVGKTRGCGGLGIWQAGKLYVSKNWRTYKIITTGPIRSEFELTYDAWDAGNGRLVSETKRISVDAGSNLSRFESTFSSDDKSPLTIGIGLTERPGKNVVVPDGSPVIDSWQSSTTKGLVVQNQSEGWMTYWQPQDFAKGTTAIAIVLPKGSIETFTNDAPNLPTRAFKPPTHTVTEGQPAVRDLLAITRAEIGQPLVYYAGAGWSESGDFHNAKSWTDYVRRFADRRDQPLVVTIGK